MQARLTGIDRGEALRYLGFRGSTPGPEAEADIARCEELLRKTAHPRAVWKRLRLLPDGSLAGTTFRPAGSDIRRLLHGCSDAVLMAATLGAEVDTLLRRLQVTNMADAMILDACAGAAAENVIGNLCEDIAAEVRPLFLTDRFSPGYGDLPLAQQAQLCAVLDTPRKIGVVLTPGGLLLPQKTITAVAGLSPAPVTAHPAGCDACAMRSSCSYRREGSHCE